MTDAIGRLDLIAAFRDREHLSRAIAALDDAVATECDTHTPAPLCESPDGSRIRPIMASAFVAGAAIALALQAWSAGWAYPLNTGGRPLLSWPAFVPTAFEIGVLFAAVGGVIAFVVEAGLGRLNRPIFDAALSAAASDDAFLLTIEGAADGSGPLRERLGKAGATSFEESRA